MLKGSDSEESVSDAGSEERVEVQWQGRPVLREARLTMQVDPNADVAELTRLLEGQRAHQQVLTAQLQEVTQQLEAVRQQSAGAVEQMAEPAVAGREWVQIQAATSLYLYQEIESIGLFAGDVGELNHFLRTGDGVAQRIEARQSSGRLDGLDAESLRNALVRRVHRRILNRIQADDSTPWSEVRRRLQKEYGDGRWTPDEDVVRMIRMTRGSRQSKGDFAAQVARTFNSVVDKYRETLPGPEAVARVAFVESLVRVTLGEALEMTIEGSVIEEANKVIDRAGREGAREQAGNRQGEWSGWRRPEDRSSRRMQPGVRRPLEHRRPAEESRRVVRPQRGQLPARQRSDPRCYSCGKKGHIQARCSEVRCYECGDTGHLARACPYMRQRRRPRDEPMEINLHVPSGKPGTRSRIHRGAAREDSGSDTERVSMASTDSEGATSSYASVAKRPRKGRGRPGGGDTA